MFFLPVDENIQLRLLIQVDAERMFALIEANRAQLGRWLPWVNSTYSLEDIQRFIRFGLRQYYGHNGMQTGIWLLGQFAGGASYNTIDHVRRETEIGYWLGQTFQGKGVMTRVCRALTTYAFDTLDLDTVKIRCAVGNEKSRAVPERLGYAIDGVGSQLDWTTDYFVDTVIYSMTAADWRLAAQARA